MAYITCRDLVLGYDGVKVTEHIDFAVNKGDYLCIVGENGAGKSTLMKTLLHLLSPMSGTIVYGDGMQAAEIGYLPQQTVVQKDFPASVWEIVLSGNLGRCGRYHQEKAEAADRQKWNFKNIFRSFYYGKEEKLRTQENLERMGIWNLRKSCYRNLSGGQQQRVLLARALCATTKILVLDEPVSGLDPRVTEELYQLIQKLNQEGITIIMVSHDIQASLQYASHILHVGKEQLFFGTTADYKESSAWKMFGQISQEREKEMIATEDKNLKKCFEHDGTQNGGTQG